MGEEIATSDRESEDDGEDRNADQERQAARTARRQRQTAKAERADAAEAEGEEGEEADAEMRAEQTATTSPTRRDPTTA